MPETTDREVQCLFCLDTIVIEDQVSLRLKGETTWRRCHCCKACIISYRDTRWSLLKEQLSGTDCLGQLKGFQKREVHRSLPFCLSTDDMVLGEVEKFGVVAELRLADGTVTSSSFNPDMTEHTRTEFHKAMCELSVEDVTEDDIRAVCREYFG